MTGEASFSKSVLTDRRGFAALFLFLLSASLASAQLPTATILGVVRDASGGVVPDASVTVRNVDTEQTRSGASAADGSFRFSALPVGNYEVRVEHPGFQTAVRSGLVLAVSQEAVVNFGLEVGGVQQTVEITAEAPLVNTTSGSVGEVVNEQKVADLPLNGRNYINLTLMQAGIQQLQNASDSAGGATVNPAFTGTWFSSNGAPVRSNTYLLDGAIMGNLFGASATSIANTTLGLDGIREYRLISNSFSAEYGLSMGSVTTIVSKSGTNKLHG